jgi:ATP-dependent exoDNAse (exonuclease V) beta subunit
MDHLVIRASAGSGKTFQLTNRLLANLVDTIPVEQIWAATFTRKAAGEILERTVSRLTDAAGSDSTARKLAQEIGRPERTITDFAGCLRTLLANLHRLRIGTLDSLFMGMAGAFPFELGLPPGWGLIEETDAAANREDALEAVLTGDEACVKQLAELYERLSPGEAKRAVRNDLLERIESLYDAYLAVPAAGWQTVRPSPPQGKFSAIIAIAKTISSRTDARFISARDKDLAKAADENWLDFVASGLAAKILTGENSYYSKPIPPDLIDCYQKLFAFAEYAINSDSADTTAAVWELLNEFHSHFEVIRISGGGLRFDDVTRALAERLQPHAPGFDYRLDGRVCHLLLDEFQDTSTLQWRVLDKLAQQVRATGGRIFAVGDVKQASFGWRGGRAELLDRLPEHLGNVPTQEMDESRRSAQAIIDCVNSVFGNLVAGVEGDTVVAGATAWQSRFLTHTTARADRVGFVQVQTGPAEIEGDGSAGRRARHYRWVAKQIQRIFADHPSATIGVLCRKNQTVGRMIYELRQLGVPASEEGGNPITDSAAVEGILSLLTLADHPGDTIAASHVTVEPFATMLRDNGYDPADPIATASCVRAALVEEGYGPVIARWAEQLKAICPNHDRLRLDQLVELADAYRGRATLRPADLVALVRQHTAALPTTHRVRVLTLHKAKGLEYDAVVLPELDVALSGGPHSPFVVADPDPPELPNGFVGPRVSAKLAALVGAEARAQTEAATRREVEESLCLLYVALTRPREALYAFPPGPTLRNRKDCWDTLLLRNLAPTLADAKARPPESVVFTAGEPNWAPDKPVAVMIETPVAEPIRFRVSGSDSKPREWLAPSHQEGGRKVSVAQLFENADAEGRRSGTLLHAWFDAIEWIDDDEPSDEQLRKIAIQMPYEGDDLEKQIELFRAALRRPAVRKILSKATYPGLESVEREKSFAVRIGDQLVNGRIDRLVWQRDPAGTLSAEVIDFKTDAISTAAVPQRVEFYRPQIEAYLQAVAAIGKIPDKHVSAALVFTVVGRVERIGIQGD